MEDTEDPDAEGKDEGDEDDPPEGESEVHADHAGVADEVGLEVRATFSLVRVDANGSGGEDGHSEDEPWELGGLVDEAVVLEHFHFE